MTGNGSSYSWLIRIPFSSSTNATYDLQYEKNLSCEVGKALVDSSQEMKTTRK